MKNKLTLNIIIDIAMMIAMAIVSVTGFMISHLMPTCHARQHGAAGGFNKILDMGRHDWGDVHRIAGIVLIALLVLHIIFHWDMVNGFFKKRIRNKAARIIVYIILLLLVVLTAGPWIYTFI